MGQLDDIITNFASIENVKAVVIFGSYTKSLIPNDLDILLVLSSDSFLTNAEDYKRVASVILHTPIFPSLDVSIKTSKEFETKNVVSLSRGFLQHLVNVGKFVYDDINLERKVRDKFKELDKVRGYWNELGDSLSVRKEYLMSLLSRSYNVSHKFYQQAVREVFKLDVPPEKDTKEGIVELFYYSLFDKVDYAELFEESPEFTSYRVNNAFKDRNVNLLRIEIERAMFALNLYLVSQQGPNSHLGKALP